MSDAVQALEGLTRALSELAAAVGPYVLSLLVGVGTLITWWYFRDRAGKRKQAAAEQALKSRELEIRQREIEVLRSLAKSVGELQGYVVAAHQTLDRVRDYLSSR
ncbi:MAG: hypothetical protein L6R43_00565 [Planctomycetes bacterium]|nr:hypothetical protein [Planctomycetota bacterium]